MTESNQRVVNVMMQKLVSRFCLTDGRAWYKQIVTGMYIFAGMAILTMVGCIGIGAFACLVVVVIELGLGSIAIFLVKLVGVIFAILAAFILLVAGWCWATDDW